MTLAQTPDRTGSRRADPPHEQLCRRCGVSCHVALPVRERYVVVPGLHCKFLEEQENNTFGCRVYADRFEQAPWCHHAEIAGPLGYLAQDCPYGTPAGLGKVRVSEEEFAELWPELLGKIRFWGVPTYIDGARLLAEVVRRSGGSWRLEPWPGDSERLRLMRGSGGLA